MKDDYTRIEVASILSHRTKKGMIELRVNDTKVVMDIPKAIEIRNHFFEAIEAAISDTIFYKLLTERIGIDEDRAGMALLDLRELRQGTREALFKQ